MVLALYPGNAPTLSLWIMDVNAVAVSCNTVLKFPTFNNILAGQYIFAVNSSCFSNANPIGDTGNMCFFQSRDIFVQEMNYFFELCSSFNLSFGKLVGICTIFFTDSDCIYISQFILPHSPCPDVVIWMWEYLVFFYDIIPFGQFSTNMEIVFVISANRTRHNRIL